MNVGVLRCFALNLTSVPAPSLDIVVFCGFVEFKLLHFTGVTSIMVKTVRTVILMMAVVCEIFSLAPLA